MKRKKNALAFICITLFTLWFFMAEKKNNSHSNDYISKIKGQYSEEVQKILERAELIHTADEIKARTAELGKEISEKLKGKNPIVMPILSGAIPFAGQLLEHISIPMELDYIKITSYKGSMTAQQKPKLIAKPVSSLKGRVILLVDDTLDTGRTAKHAFDYCKEHGAKEVYMAVLTDKKQKRDKETSLLKADFVAFETENLFLLGTGLDYKHQLYNLPGLYVVK